MIPVSVLGVIVRTVGQYVLIKTGGEMVKSVVEAYMPIPVVNQPSLSEQVLKVVVASVSAAGTSSAVSKYLGGGNSKQVKRIDDLEMKLGEEVKRIDEDIENIERGLVSKIAQTQDRLIEGVNVDLEEERMINSLYRAISAYLDLYIRKYPQYERLEWVRFMLDTQFDTLNLKALFRVEGLLEGMSDVKDIDYFCDVLLFNHTVKALIGDDTPKAIDFVRENADKRIRELENIKRAYEDDNVVAGQRLNEEYLERYDYAKVAEDYERECKRLEEVVRAAGMKNIEALIREKMWGEVGNLRVFDVLNHNYVLEQTDWMFVTMLFGKDQMEGRIGEFRSNEGREERTIGWADKKHESRWDKDIKLSREDMRKVIGFVEDEIKVIEKMELRKVEIWEGRPYKGDKDIDSKDYRRVVRECEELKRELGNMDRPQNVVVSCTQDGGMEITDRVGDSKDLGVIKSFADATGVGEKSRKMYQRAEELGLLDGRTRAERWKDRMRESEEREKEEREKRREFKNKQMRERNKDWQEHRELVKRLDEEERIRDKRVLIVSIMLGVLGIGGAVWLDNRNRINHTNVPDLDGLKREGGIFMIGVLKWVILLVLIVVGLLFLPHVVSLIIYLIRRCWKSLKMTYDGIRNGFDSNDREEDEMEDKDAKTD